MKHFINKQFAGVLMQEQPKPKTITLHPTIGAMQFIANAKKKTGITSTNNIANNVFEALYKHDLEKLKFYGVDLNSLQN